MANMNKQGYSISWQTNTITMTKRFAEEANQYGSEAYNLLMGKPFPQHPPRWPLSWARCWEGRG